MQQALDDLIKNGGQTIVVIAHRLSTIRDANNIVVLKQGEIAEQGTHDELVAKDGVYKKLVDRQLVQKALDDGNTEALTAQKEDWTIPLRLSLLINARLLSK